ncbi:MAG: hypothetical protein LBE05_05860 [Microbacterium sp.]|jgi:hypothetical protein|nr:hypothetical protein [Microbacterium sp.]
MTVSRQRKDRIITRDGGRCQLRLPICQIEATTADHRANRGRGGSQMLDHPSNLIAACGLCNEAKERADKKTRAELIACGHRVEAHATNEKTLARVQQTPYLGHDGAWYVNASDDVRRRVAGPPAVAFAEAAGLDLTDWQRVVLAMFPMEVPS